MLEGFRCGREKDAYNSGTAGWAAHDKNVARQNIVPSSQLRVSVYRTGRWQQPVTIIATEPDNVV